MGPEDLKYKADLNVVIEHIKKSTCQILYNGKPEVQGSGVLLTDGTQFFLLTAAHVVENEMISLYIRSGLNTVIPIEYDDSVINKVPKRSKDKIDVAILKLSKVTSDMIKDYYRFVDLPELGINHKVDGSYVGAGFPATMTKVNRETGTVTSESTFIQFPAAEKEMYAKIECNSATNILLFFPKRKMINFQTDERGTAPNLNGMSGGGLWKLFYNDQDELDAKLVGIMTEWSAKKNINYVISTRIDVLSEMLKDLFFVSMQPSEIVGNAYN